MCECHIVYSFGKEGLSKEDINNFFTLLELGSYSNRDAYGFFSDDYLYRKGIAFYEEKKEAKGAFVKNLLDKNPRFLVGHNRLTTQGSEKQNINNHPFPTTDWIVVHNGILSNDKQLKNEFGLTYTEETDSAIIVNLLQYFSDKDEESTEAISKTAELLEGRYSVCAYNKTEDRLFYFKNSSTSFDFRLYELANGKRILTGSTSKENFDDLFVDSFMIFRKPLFTKFYEREAEEGVVYEMDKRGIIEAQYFKPTTTSTTKYYGSSYSETTEVTGRDNKKYKVTGGVYENEYSDEFEKAGKDIDYMDSTGKIVPPFQLADVRRNIMEDAQHLAEDVGDLIGIDFDYDIDYHKEEVLMRTHDATIGMSQVVLALSDNGFQANAINDNTISVSFESMMEAYK